VVAAAKGRARAPERGTRGAPLTGDLRVRGDERAFDHESYDAKFGGVSLSRYEINQFVYEQDTVADSIFCILHGTVKLTAASENGREAVVALLGTGEFCGTGCLSGQPQHAFSAIAVTECLVVMLKKETVRRALEEDPCFSRLFISHLLTREIRLKDDLVDQLCSSSEKRLARVLLLMAEPVKRGWGKPLSPRINQKMLANMVGTTRSRVNFFLNGFRRAGHIDCDGDIRVHASLKRVTRRRQNQFAVGLIGRPAGPSKK
jgi:CRP/FNR family cyclic AMP-dependent transcriptional regulator